jgi:hypothetical protein
LNAVLLLFCLDTYLRIHRRYSLRVREACTFLVVVLLSLDPSQSNNTHESVGARHRLHATGSISACLLGILMSFRYICGQTTDITRSTFMWASSVLICSVLFAFACWLYPVTVGYAAD